MWRIAVPVVATIALLLFVLREGGPGGRTDRDEAPTAAAPEAAAPRPAPVEVDFGSVPDREVPATLRGTVFDPHGRPVPGADVMVLRPKLLELVHTGEDGRYELSLSQPGPHLVEAGLTIHLAPQRLEVLVPDEGDPAPLDFHLGEAGFVFGEIVASGHPVSKGNVDVYQGEEWILDTTCEHGIFCFTEEPPKDVTLHLRIETPEGAATGPVEFVYEGERVDLGRIEFVRYPAVRVRMRLPDGTLATTIHAGHARGALFDQGRVSCPQDGIVEVGPTVLVTALQPVQASLVLCDAGDCYVVCDFLLEPGKLVEAEVAVRPGPVTLRTRLVDEYGKGIRARFARRDGPVAESREDGAFAVELPHGGLHALELQAVHVEGIGWVPLRQLGPDKRGFLVDADRPGSPGVLDLDRRVLLVTEGPTYVSVDGPYLSLSGSAGEGPLGLLSRPLEPGPQRYWKHERKELRHLVPLTPDEGVAFDLAPRGLTVVDTR